MILDPVQPVECDNCGEIEELSLTRTGRGWDDRDVVPELERMGWIVIENSDQAFCSESCQLEYDEKKEKK